MYDPLCLLQVNMNKTYAMKQILLASNVAYVTQVALGLLMEIKLFQNV